MKSCYRLQKRCLPLLKKRSKMVLKLRLRMMMRQLLRAPTRALPLPRRKLQGLSLKLRHLPLQRLRRFRRRTCHRLLLRQSLKRICPIRSTSRARMATTQKERLLQQATPQPLPTSESTQRSPRTTRSTRTGWCERDYSHHFKLITLP